MIRLSIAAVIAVLAVGLPVAAQAKSGHMTCQFYEAGKRRVVYTRAFAADSASVDAMYDAFVADMKQQGYVSDLSGVSGACHWEASPEQAEKAASGYRQYYTKDGANAVGVPFSPPAVLPTAGRPAGPAAPTIGAAPVETSVRHADKAALMMTPELIARTRPKSPGSRRWFMCAATDRSADTLYYSSTIEADAASAGDLAAGFVAAVNLDRGTALPATAGTCRAGTDEVKVIDGFNGWRLKQAGTQVNTAWMAPVG